MRCLLFIFILAPCLGWAAALNCEGLFATSSNVRSNLLRTNLDVRNAPANLEYLFHQGGAENLRISPKSVEAQTYFSLGVLSILKEMRSSNEQQLKSLLPKTISLKSEYIERERPDNRENHVTFYLRNDGFLKQRLLDFPEIESYFLERIESGRIDLIDFWYIHEISDIYFDIYREENAAITSTSLKNIIAKLKNGEGPEHNGIFEVPVSHELSKQDLIKYNSPQHLLLESVFEPKVFDTTMGTPIIYKQHDRAGHNKSILESTYRFFRETGLSNYTENLKLFVASKIDNIHYVNPKLNVSVSQFRDFLYDFLFVIEHETSTNLFKISSANGAIRFKNGLHIKVALTWILKYGSLDQIPLDSYSVEILKNQLKGLDLKSQVKQLILMAVPQNISPASRDIYRKEIIDAVAETLTEFYLQSSKKIKD